MNVLKAQRIVHFKRVNGMACEEWVFKKKYLSGACTPPALIKWDSNPESLQNIQPPSKFTQPLFS